MRKRIITITLWTTSLVLVSMTSAWAGAKLVVTSANIKNESIISADVKNGSLASGDLSTAARAALKGNAGVQGPQGAQGAQGAAGPSSSSSYFNEASLSSGFQSLSVSCPDGKKAVGGGGNIVEPIGAPIYMMESHSNAATAGEAPTGWTVTVNNTGGAHNVSVEVVCTP